MISGSHKGTGFKSVKWVVPDNVQSVYQVCGCKHTKNKPLCDGTHTNLPEEVNERQKKCDKKDCRSSDKKLCTNCGRVPDF